MMIFVDTSAIYALMDANDRNHEPAKAAWNAWLDQPIQFATSNYVLLESLALIQHHLGLQAARDFQEELSPVLRVHWIDAELHGAALSMVMAVGLRDFTLVDAANVELMHRLHARTIFAFDHHYPARGLDRRP
jgi:predicted nucleic acid-binding protein